MTKALSEEHALRRAHMDLAYDVDKGTIRIMLAISGWSIERIAKWEKMADEEYPERRNAICACPSGSVAVWKEEICHE